MKKPHISINLAMTADGKISPHQNSPSHFTSQADFNRLLELRKNADALLVGRKTWITDQMTLTAPDTPLAKQPLRCVASRSGHFPLDHPMFQKEGGRIFLLAEQAQKQSLTPKSAEIFHGSLSEWLRRLAEEQSVKKLHCEGGSQLIQTLAHLFGIDTLYLTWAGHTLFGGENALKLTGSPQPEWLQSQHFTLEDFEITAQGEAFLTYQKRK